jgi:hypothetical protein
MWRRRGALEKGISPERALPVLPARSTGKNKMEIMRPVKRKIGISPVAGPFYTPLAGKTYSLFGNALSTDPYYDRVRRLADEILWTVPGEESLLTLIRKTGGRKRFLVKAARRADGTAISAVLRMLGPALSPYTTNVRTHLKGLSLLSVTDPRLRTTEEQYHLHMLEVELANRVHRDLFLQCGFRIALLPHCLRDFRRECESFPGDLDAVCAGCSETCLLHRVSALLREAGIHPYIWRNAELGSLLRRLEGKGNFGVLGIACLPELAWGMRACMERKIPVVGIPLDANRCMRWMGRFKETSVNLERLWELAGGGRIPIAPQVDDDLST